MMHKRTVERVDGRRFILYGRDEVPDPIGAPRSSRRGPRQSAHLRWHVLRGEWVAYAGQKQAHEMYARLLPGYKIEPIDVRLFLRHRNQPLTETWMYQWTPPTPKERQTALGLATPS